MESSHVHILRLLFHGCDWPQCLRLRFSNVAGTAGFWHRQTFCIVLSGYDQIWCTSRNSYNRLGIAHIVLSSSPSLDQKDINSNAGFLVFFFLLASSTQWSIKVRAMLKQHLDDILFLWQWHPRKGNASKPHHLGLLPSSGPLPEITADSTKLFHNNQTMSWTNGENLA